jgi:hypothetical protein
LTRIISHWGVAGNAQRNAASLFRRNAGKKRTPGALWRNVGRLRQMRDSLVYCRPVDH